MKKRTKYYYVLLANYFDNYCDYTCTNKHSYIQDVLEKSYSSLNKNNPIDDFYGLDSKIKIKDQGIIIKGMFPVIAEEKEGKLVDIITGEPIVSAKENPKAGCLSYIEKYQIDELTVETLLNGVVNYDKEIYIDTIKGIKYYSKLVSLNLNKKSYYKLIIETEEKNQPFPIYAMEINGRMVEIITETPIYHNENNAISNSLNYYSETKVSSEEIMEFFNKISHDENLSNEYTKYINKIKQEKTKQYNGFVELKLSKQLNTKKRIRLNEQSVSNN